MTLIIILTFLSITIHKIFPAMLSFLRISTSSFLLISALATSVIAQQSISGTVTDSDGLALIGVTISEMGNPSNGTTTDLEGYYELVVSQNATSLTFQYVGYKTTNLAIDGQSVLNLVLSGDVQVLEEVFVTATSKPIRRIEAVTAVESISAKAIERLNPVSVADLVRFTPGLYVQTQAGRVRNFIFTRGFPDATSNGFVYTSLLIDGLRTFASPEMIPDGAFRNDLNVEKVEVVRGSAATLYGRGAAAGAINIISRTGKEELNGTARFTYGQNNWRQFDFNLNGPLNESKTWRYNIGGFYLDDDGFRDNVFPDQGLQLRANVDHFFNNDKGQLRIYWGAIDLDVYNNLSIPYAANDLSRPAGNWTTRDAVLQPGNPFEGSSWPVTNPNTGVTTQNTYDRDYRRGNFSEGFNVGSNLDYKLGKGWAISNKFKFQRMNVGIGFDFGISTNFGDTQTRIIFGGGSTNGGSDSQEYIEEFRLTKYIESGTTEHNLVFGFYSSNINVLVNSVGSFYSANTADADNVIYDRQPFGFPFNLAFRNGDYDERTTSYFAGDEIKFNNKFTLNGGIRYDRVNIDVTDNYQEGQENLNQVQGHDGVSASLGFNYLINPLTAIYGNIVRSFRAPDYAAYTPVRFIPGTTILDKPRVENNENVTSVEIGYRKSTGDFSFDGGFFNTTITNRVVPTFVGAIATQVPAGDNRITGAELSVIYTPQNLLGFYVRSSYTYQNTSYTSFDRVVDGETFDLSGNNISNVPSSIWNFSIGYESDRFGINFNNNFVSSRPIDIYNTASYPSRSLMDANIHVNASKRLRFKLGAQNLSNVTHAASVISAATDDTFRNAAANNFEGNFRNVRGVPYLPRRIFGSVEYRF